MHLKIVRDVFTAKSTLGTLTIDDAFECYTLEDVDRKLEDGGTKIYGETAIPRGTYDVIIDFSPKYQKPMPHILNVPQYEGVRIHPGNFPKDTEGCILLGLSRGIDRVNSSVLAFQRLLAKLDAAYDSGETVTLEIT